MTARSRLRRLGVDGRPRPECPECGGSGQVMLYGPGLDQTDTPHAGWVIRRRVHECRVLLAGRRGEEAPPAFDEEEPPGHLGRCTLCRGAGTVAAAVVARREAAAAAGDDGRLVEQMRQTVANMAGYRIVDRVEPVDSPPRLHAVTSDDSPSRQ